MSDASFSIRATSRSDLPVVLDIHRRAFGGDVEPSLVRDLLGDPEARPALSLLASADGPDVGHVLFTPVTVDGEAGGGTEGPRASILCPLAVVPDEQRAGCGTALMQAGLERLRRAKQDLVFVLGDPRYYARVGFESALACGLEPPFETAHAEAWMVLWLGGAKGTVTGKVRPAAALSRAELW